MPDTLTDLERAVVESGVAFKKAKKFYMSTSVNRESAGVTYEESWRRHERALDALIAARTAQGRSE